MNTNIRDEKLEKQRIWFHNYFLLKRLEPNQKMYVLENGRLEIDDRYFRWFRRRLSRNSPFELIEPIKETFEGIQENYANIIETLKHLLLVLRHTYPNDTSGLVKSVEDLYNDHRDKLSNKSGQILNNLLSMKEYELYCTGTSK